MPNRPGFENMGVTFDSPFLGVWPTKIGSFILNFGGIELISYQQLKLLEPSHEEFVRNLDQFLGKRIDRLVTLLPKTDKLNSEELPAVIESWEKARELAVWRNRIAHNPVLPIWKPGSDAEKDQPDVLGVPDFRQFKDGTKGDSIPLELMDKLIDAAAELAQELHTISARLQGEA